MSDKPDSQEKPTDSPSSPLEVERTKARKIVQGFTQALIQWMPLGGSGWAFVSFLLQREWLQALLMFPVMIVTVVWAAYTESFLTGLREVYQERGRRDVDSLMAWLERVDRAIHWQLAGTEDKYLRCQGNACREYRTEGFSRGTFVPLLSEVFVPLELSNAFVRGVSGEELPMLPGFRQEAPELLQTAAPNELRIWDLLAKVKQYPVYSRMAILAWGGYGKTTLLKHITYTYTEHRHRRYRVPQFLPVLLPLRKWQEAIATEQNLDLPVLIEKHHLPSLPQGADLKLPPQWAKNQLHDWKMLVMFDGFDEVKLEWRQAVSRWLDKQMTDYQKSAFILTSRPGGYKDYIAANPPSSKLYVKPFNADQKERFVRQWYLTQERYARGGRNTPEVKQIADSNADNLLEQLKSHPELDILSKNPLLLNIIANLHRSYSGQKLPQRRNELYQDICTLQLKDRPRERGIDMLVPFPESQQFLQKVALTLVDQNQPSIKRQELETLILNHLKNLDYGNTVEASAFLNKIVDVSELIVKRDEDYEFAHLSFQGYLAAAEIKEQKQEQLLLEHWQDSWWKETILLYCAQVNPSNLIRAFLKSGEQEAVNLAQECLKESPRKVSPEIEAELQQLKSSVSNLLYQQLESYLKNGQWKEAEHETYRVLIQKVGKEEGDLFDNEDLDILSSEDLDPINQLWSRYSFEEQFYFLEGSGKLPGALLPEESDNITYIIDKIEHKLTPLLPLKSEIIKYFSLSSQEVIKSLKIIPLIIGNQSGVQVNLLLPLSSINLTIQRDYPIEESNAITATPLLEIWPNFQAPNWQAYYTFYFDDRWEATKHNKTFRAIFPEVKEIHPPELNNYQMTRLESFPEYFICQDETGLNQGLILLKTPPTVGDQNQNKSWTVGVDFGTCFTNVYYQINRRRNALTLSPLNLQVTKTNQMGRTALLYEYFMSAKPLKFPLSSVLTIKGGKEQERPVFDGRLYIPEDVRSFDPNQDDIKTGLKWKTESLPYNRTFLKHLSLLISAEAARNSIRKIEWSISYPSAFSRTEKNLYRVTWQKIIENLGQTTGIKQEWLAKGTPYRSESLALAHYFADEEGKDLVYTTCIDMGGGTSEISIWVGNRLIHQCSVQLAGRLLFSQFLKHKPDFLNQQFNVDLLDLASELRDEPFFVKLDGILAAEGNEWLTKNRALIDDNPDLQDIVQLSSLGIAGLYYYIGLVLQALDVEGLYNRKRNTPVYIGGNGCRILNWLDLSGTFTPEWRECDAAILFSHILSKGSGFEDTKEMTILSSQPKAEVACGLVLDQNETRLTGLQQEDDDVFAGENCLVNGELIKWQDRLNILKFNEINSFTIDSNLTNLKQFLDDFQQTFQEKRIVSIKPLENYDNEEWRRKLWNNVSRRVEAELTKMTGRKAEDVRVEPPFIIGLKALLKELSERM